MTTCFLSLSLLLFVLANLTSEKTAIPVATIIVASQFSRSGLDDPHDIDDLRKKFFSTGQTVFHPLPDEKVTITKSDLETLSPREIRLKIFRQVVEPFYYGKIDEKTQQQAGLLALLNQNSHVIIQKLFLVSIFPFFFTLAGLIFFSYKYGKLISPAVVFIFASGFPAAFLFIISNSKSDNGNNSLLYFLPHEIAQQIASTLAVPYYLLFWIGVALLILTPILKSFTSFGGSPEDK